MGECLLLRRLGIEPYFLVFKNLPQRYDTLMRKRLLCAIY